MPPVSAAAQSNRALIRRLPFVYGWVVLPLAWAGYFGRASYGAIRGIALSVQVLAQAAGPLLSGMLHDATGSYTCRCNSVRCSVVARQQQRYVGRVQPAWRRAALAR